VPRQKKKSSLLLKLFSLCWNVMVVTVHRPLKFVVINANGIGIQAYVLREQKQKLK
jgi:hypothetical protein